MSADSMFIYKMSTEDHTFQLVLKNEAVDCSRDLNGLVLVRTSKYLQVCVIFKHTNAQLHVNERRKKRERERERKRAVRKRRTVNKPSTSLPFLLRGKNTDKALCMNVDRTCLFMELIISCTHSSANFTQPCGPSAAA